jgi:hypothetical protein
MAQAKRDWLEPPAWWKKWRPLRLVLMGILLICFAIVIRPLLDPDAQYVRHERAPQPTAAATAAPQEAKKASPEPPAPLAKPIEVATEPESAVTATDTVIPPTGTDAVDGAPEADPASVTSPPGAPLPTEQSEPETETAETTPLPTAPPSTTPTSPVDRFTAMASPVNLLAPFHSYLRVDAVMTDLQQRGYLPALESSHQPVHEDVPPHDVDIITVLEYTHWEQPGRLELVFFNDRLYQTEFEPEDPEAYRAAQRKHLPELPRERSGRSEMVRGHLRIASSLDLAVSEVGEKLRSRPFLLWQDLRLVKQREEWDQRYALEAVTD